MFFPFSYLMYQFAFNRIPRRRGGTKKAEAEVEAKKFLNLNLHLNLNLIFFR